jgi:hypothetical protein
MGLRRWLRKQTATPEELEVLNAVDWAPPIALGELPEDTRARIVGTVVPFAGTLRSPLTGRECVWWSVRVEAGTFGITYRDCRNFVLADGTHRALIDLLHARLVIRPTHFHTVFRFERATPAEQGFLQIVPFTGPIFRFAERIIAPGTKLSVVGPAIREPDPDGTEGYRERTSWLRISGSPAHPLHVTDE